MAKNILERPEFSKARRQGHQCLGAVVEAPGQGPRAIPTSLCGFLTQFGGYCQFRSWILHSPSSLAVGGGAAVDFAPFR